MKNKELDDESRIIARLKKGHEGAFRILMQQYQGRLYNIALGITADKEESLEIVQEVFFKVYRKIHTFQQEAKLSSWLHRITVNESLNWKRRWKRRFKWHHQPMEGSDGSHYPELTSGDPDPETAYQKKELENALWKKLKELPEKARVVFVLNVMEDLTYDEIADILKISRGTVSSRLFYARRKLKESMNDSGDSQKKCNVEKIK